MEGLGAKTETTTTSVRVINGVLENGLWGSRASTGEFRDTWMFGEPV